MVADAEQTNANRRYKDSVFTRYFSERNRLIELYNALKGTEYPAETEIKIVTLEDALFLKQINDLAFLIDGRLIVLVEHQSTLNRNIPLRMLMYIGREYERITDGDNIYRNRLVKIAKPEFFVLYNGVEPCEDEFEMCLSDAFFDAPEIPDLLELRVMVYNVNAGHNAEILNRSKSLNDYAEFIETVRDGLARGMELGEAIRDAVRRCVGRGIMKDFLQTNGSEVENMLMTEFDLDVAARVWKEEGFEIGVEKGREKGREEGREEGREAERRRLISLLQGGYTIEQLEALLRENADE
ncbi:MAG: hypothetical protein LBC28_04120 [Oscillospiraceae bacterium]|jgi:hypothetical protein|nr:hypothetical protein [Oscillospiraceae bacterium]